MVSKLQNDTIDHMRQALLDVNLQTNPAPRIPMTVTSFRGNLAPAKREAYIFAGNATFTIKSPSGVRFTYCVIKSNVTPQYPKPTWFVAVLTSPDVYSLLGRIPENNRTTLYTTRATKVNPGAPAWIAFMWFLSHLTDARIEVWHEGHCGRCGRPLTVPESIEAGIGPTCAEKGL